MLEQILNIPVIKELRAEIEPLLEAYPKVKPKLEALLSMGGGIISKIGDLLLEMTLIASPDMPIPKIRQFQTDINEILGAYFSGAVDQKTGKEITPPDAARDLHQVIQFYHGTRKKPDSLQIDKKDDKKIYIPPKCLQDSQEEKEIDKKDSDDIVI